MKGIRLGRPKTFGEAVALQQTMHDRWLYGYSCTFFSDPMHTMGIFKARLYQTFFNKKALFLLALHRYQTKNCSSLVHDLDQSESGFAYDRNLFYVVEHEVSKLGVKRGCLLVNLANGIGRNDEKLSVSLKQTLRSVEHIFAKAIERAQQKGDIPAYLESQSMARFLMTSISGIRIMIRVDASDDEISPVINPLLLSMQSPRRCNPDSQIKWEQL